MIAKLLNLVSLKVGWLSCILGAAAGAPAFGPAVVLVLVAVHIALRPNRTSELALIVGAGILGYAIDSILVLTGMLGFPEPAVWGWPSTVWMVALWCNLATSLRGCLSWLQDRLVLAAVVGAITGPLAYVAGARLGAATLPEPWALSVGAIAVAWIVGLPALILLERWTRRLGAPANAGWQEAVEGLPS